MPAPRNPIPPPAGRTETSTVVIERCSGYSPVEVRSALLRSLAPVGGMEAFVGRGQKVLLKPNLLAPAAADEAVTTHPTFVAEIARLVLESDGVPVIGDSPSFGSAAQVAERCGLTEAARALGVEIIEFRDPVPVAPPGRLFRGVGPVIDRAVLDADVVISLPKVKAHQQIGYTGAVKNTFGCMNGKRKALRHLLTGHAGIEFGRMLLDIHACVRPALTLMDGIVAMEGPGPRRGRPIALGIVLAGTDAVALDMVLGSILSAPLEPVYLAAAREAGRGPGRREDIVVLGQSIESVRAPNFRFPVIYPLGFSPLRIVKSVAKDLIMRMTS